jgi:uroporphyrin-III C-methyltransferase/precorrin-2 dehydrogenase/sirohydrochlorin ferrochelatase
MSEERSFVEEHRRETRAKIEALLPKRLQDWAQAARAWRPDAQARAVSFAQKRGFWEKFTDLAWKSTDRAPTDEDRVHLLRDLEPAAVH